MRISADVSRSVSTCFSSLETHVRNVRNSTGSIAEGSSVGLHRAFRWPFDYSQWRYVSRPQEASSLAELDMTPDAKSRSMVRWH